MGAGLANPTHLIFLAILGLLLFGAKRLPEVGRSLGTGLREFKTSVSGLDGVTGANGEPLALDAGRAPEPAELSDGGHEPAARI